MVKAFDSAGLQGLIPAPRGPRGPHKITPQMLRFVDDYKARHGRVGARRLVLSRPSSASGFIRAVSRRRSNDSKKTAGNWAMMPDAASDTYEVWRRLWLSGADSNAIAACQRRSESAREWPE